MKRISLTKLFIVFSVAMIMAGCREKEDFVLQNNYPEFQGVIESVTKTTVDGLNVIWSRNDSISIFRGSTANMRYNINRGVGTTSATFRYGTSVFVAGSMELDRNYALYPFDTLTSMDGNGTINYTFPSTQKYVENSFACNSYPMVAATERVEDTGLSFKNLCGIIKIQMTGAVTDTIMSVKIQGNNNEILSGTASITAAFNQAPTVAMNDEGIKYVTMNCGEGVVLNPTTPKSFWLVVPPTTFAQGFTITAIAKDGHAMLKRLSSEVTIERSDIQPMTSFVFTPGAGFVPIPDANFKTYLVQNFDTDHDGEISFEEALAVKEIDCSEKSISSLSGVEYFTSLTTLWCWGNLLTEVDVSHNIALRDFICDGNQLLSLDVSHNTSLKWLDCRYNQLSILDVSRNTSLTRLDCHDNQITSLNANIGPSLNWIHCDNNPLGSLNLSNNTALTVLDCRNNQLSSLDLSNNTALTNFSCDKNQLTSLDLSSNTALTNLSCYNNQLTSLDLSSNTALTNLSCYNNQLTSLDLSSNTALKYLICYDNQLTSLDLSNNTALANLSCYNNQLTSLDVSHNIALFDLNCSGNQLTSLDLTNNRELTSLSCNGNSIPSIRVYGCNSIRVLKGATTTITYIDAAGNEIIIPANDPEITITDANFKSYLLARIDFDGNGKISVNEANKVTLLDVESSRISSLEGVNNFTSLKKLWCSYNQLTTLDVSSNTALEIIDFRGNQLSSIDLSHNTALKMIGADRNRLSTLDVSSNTAITALYCQGNLLTSLDISHNTSLLGLHCSSNQLSSLTVTNNTALKYITCSSNRLSSLDLSHNTALVTLVCGGNQLSSLDVSHNASLTELACKENPNLTELWLATGMTIGVLNKDDFTVIKYK